MPGCTLNQGKAAMSHRVTLKQTVAQQAWCQRSGMPHRKGCPLRYDGPAGFLGAIALQGQPEVPQGAAGMKQQTTASTLL